MYRIYLQNALSLTCPFSSIFGWYIEVTNVILGGLKGYSAGKLISILNAPLLYGGSSWNYKAYCQESD